MAMSSIKLSTAISEDSVWIIIILLLLCSTSIVVETKLHVMARHSSKVDIQGRVVCVTTLKNDENYGL